MRSELTEPLKCLHGASVLCGPNQGVVSGVRGFYYPLPTATTLALEYC